MVKSSDKPKGPPSKIGRFSVGIATVILMSTGVPMAIDAINERLDAAFNTRAKIGEFFPDITKPTYSEAKRTEIAELMREDK